MFYDMQFFKNVLISFNINAVFGGNEDYTLHSDFGGYNQLNTATPLFYGTSGSRAIDNLAENKNRNARLISYKTINKREQNQPVNSSSVGLGAVNQLDDRPKQANSDRSVFDSRAFPDITLNSNLTDVLSSGKKQRKSQDSHQTDVPNSLKSDLLSTESSLTAMSSDNEALQRIGGAPSGDPTGPPIPVGDGWGFLLAIVLVYGLWKKMKLRLRQLVQG